jgi:hypothetical protein
MPSHDVVVYIPDAFNVSIDYMHVDGVAHRPLCSAGDDLQRVTYRVATEPLPG